MRDLWPEQADAAALVKHARDPDADSVEIRDLQRSLLQGFLDLIDDVVQSGLGSLAHLAGAARERLHIAHDVHDGDAGVHRTHMDADDDAEPGRDRQQRRPPAAGGIPRADLGDEPASDQLVANLGNQERAVAGDLTQV